MTSIWLSVDPLADRYPHWNAYSFTGDNPINYFDPNGKEWDTDADKEMAENLMNKFQKKIEKYDKQIDKFRKKAGKFMEKGKLEKAQKYIEKTKEAILGKHEMKDAYDEFSMMGAREDVKFTFKYVDGSSGYTYMDKEGKVVLQYASEANAVHEAHHGYQHLTGDIELVAGTGGGYYADLGDEVSAYKRQYYFDKTSVSGLYSKGGAVKSAKDITNDWVKKLYYYNKDDKAVYPYRDHPEGPKRKP